MSRVIMSCPLCGGKMKEVARKSFCIIFECFKCDTEVTVKGFSETGERVKVIRNEMPTPSKVRR